MTLILTEEGKGEPSPPPTSSSSTTTTTTTTTSSTKSAPNSAYPHSPSPNLARQGTVTSVSGWSHDGSPSLSRDDSILQRGYSTSSTDNPVLQRTASANAGELGLGSSSARRLGSPSRRLPSFEFDSPEVEKRMSPLSFGPEAHLGRHSSSSNPHSPNTTTTSTTSTGASRGTAGEGEAVKGEGGDAAQVGVVGGTSVVEQDQGESIPDVPAARSTTTTTTPPTTTPPPPPTTTTTTDVTTRLDKAVTTTTTTTTTTTPDDTVAAPSNNTAQERWNKGIQGVVTSLRFAQVSTERKATLRSRWSKVRTSVAVQVLHSVQAAGYDRTRDLTLQRARAHGVQVQNTLATSTTLLGKPTTTTSTTTTTTTTNDGDGDGTDGKVGGMGVIPAWKQGDAAHYTRQSQAQRNINKTSATLKAQVQKWWDLHIKTAGSRQHINQKMYTQMSIRLYKALVNPFVFTKAQESALHDWEQDSSKANEYGIGYDELYHALFELADLWTPTTEEQDYIAFLDYMWHKITQETADGKVKWRPLDDVYCSDDEGGLPEPVVKRVTIQLLGKNRQHQQVNAIGQHGGSSGSSGSGGLVLGSKYCDVHITGAHFFLDGPLIVLAGIRAQRAVNARVRSDTEIQCLCEIQDVSLGGDIIVVIGDRQSAPLTLSLHTISYINAPHVTAVRKASARDVGRARLPGRCMSVMGSNFLSSSTVLVDGIELEHVVIFDVTQLVVMVPDDMFELLGRHGKPSTIQVMCDGVVSNSIEKDLSTLGPTRGLSRQVHTGTVGHGGGGGGRHVSEDPVINPTYRLDTTIDPHSTLPIRDPASISVQSPVGFRVYRPTKPLGANVFDKAPQNVRRQIINVGDGIPGIPGYAGVHGGRVHPGQSPTKRLAVTRFLAPVSHKTASSSPARAPARSRSALAHRSPPLAATTGGIDTDSSPGVPTRAQSALGHLASPGAAPISPIPHTETTSPLAPSQAPPPQVIAEPSSSSSPPPPPPAVVVGQQTTGVTSLQQRVEAMLNQPRRRPAGGGSGNDNGSGSGSVTGPAYGQPQGRPVARAALAGLAPGNAVPSSRPAARSGSSQPGRVSNSNTTNGLGAGDKSVRIQEPTTVGSHKPRAPQPSPASSHPAQLPAEPAITFQKRGQARGTSYGSGSVLQQVKYSTGAQDSSQAIRSAVQGGLQDIRHAQSSAHAPSHVPVINKGSVHIPVTLPRPVPRRVQGKGKNTGSNKGDKTRKQVKQPKLRRQPIPTAIPRSALAK